MEKRGWGGLCVAERGSACVADAQCSVHRASSCLGGCLEHHGESRRVWRSTLGSGICGERPPPSPACSCSLPAAPRMPGAIWADSAAKAVGLMQASLPAPRTPCPSPAQPCGSLADKRAPGIFHTVLGALFPLQIHIRLHLRPGWG